MTKLNADEATPRWAGIDDGLQEKQEGSGAIYDDATGDFLFRVPPQYRPMIVERVNAHDALVAERDALLAEVERLRQHVKDLNHDMEAMAKEFDEQAGDIHDEYHERYGNLT